MILIILPAKRRGGSGHPGNDRPLEGKPSRDPAGTAIGCQPPAVQDAALSSRCRTDAKEGALRLPHLSHIRRERRATSSPAGGGTVPCPPRQGELRGRSEPKGLAPGARAAVHTKKAPHGRGIVHGVLCVRVSLRGIRDGTGSVPPVPSCLLPLRRGRIMLSSGSCPGPLPDTGACGSDPFR